MLWLLLLQIFFTEDQVSLDLTEETLQSMEVGMAFRDYVIFFIIHS